MTRAGQRGFSLLEAMIAMLLVMTLLGMISTLMREYSDVARHSAARDNTFDGVQFALTEMGHELGSAQRMLLPPESSPAANSTVLRFQRIDPTLQRFPDDAALSYDEDGEPEMWNTRDPDKWMTVEYRENDAGALVRTVTRPNGDTENQTMVDKIDSLLVTGDPAGFYTISLSFKEEKGRLRVFTTRARRWVQR